jgi:tRNA 2-thiouridine synthesizing protein A
MTAEAGGLLPDDVAATANVDDGEIAELDCRGQRCPLPVITLAKRLAELPVGARLRVLADDPAAATDIPAWCRLRGHEYLGTSDNDAYLVRRSH